VYTIAHLNNAAIVD